MLEQIEALTALRDTGTMGAAAARLRVTQSAVSKRIATLSATVGAPLVEPDGRRVRLTAEGERVLEEAGPLLARLREVLVARAPGRPTIRLAATESLLASSLPARLAEVRDQLGIDVEIHAHRGPVLVERVRSGGAALGIGADAGTFGDLDAVPLGEEAMVIVPGPFAVTPGVPLGVWCIEPASLTWQAMARRFRRLSWPLDVVGRLESFAALVQVARAGFAPALVPIGVAEAMGAAFLPVPGLSRPLVVVGRPTTLRQPAPRAFVAALRERWGAGQPPG